MGELKNQQDHSTIRKIVILHSIYFSNGFTIVYFALVFQRVFIGKFFSNYNDVIRMFGGIFLVTIGMFILDIFKPSFLMKTHRFQSVIVGIVFGAGWSPCIGPIFGAIMYANIMYPTQTFLILQHIHWGFCIPFVIMAFFISKTKLILKYSTLLMKIGGVLMIIIGLMVFFDKMTFITIWGSEIQYYFEEMLSNES
ncbi:cytochrome c-type biogenesis protein [Neobacillus niacini]|uniref:cytochrome c biogenesis CcdA family protein n=1 Tax=Neobacillus niacini TaxID=86668 RepID=UPI0027809F06|nr:cytochrome c-type biogenesis protein [Neobacillus niacini]